MDRADFIAQMIAELSRQKEEDEMSFLNPRVRSSKEIFESLCFDFPIVSTEEILIISAAINQLTLSSPKDSASTDFWLNDKFLENLSFLSGSAPNADDKEREGAVSAFCSNIYFSLPFRLLSMTRRELHFYFTGQSQSSVDQHNLKETELLQWEAVCQKYRNMILEGSASALLSIGSREVLAHLTNISKTIKGIRRDSSEDKVSDVGSVTTTLEQYFVFNNSKALKAEVSSKHADSQPLSIPASSQTKGDSDKAESELPSESESECVVISGIAKEIWVHLAFLCRDIIVQRPEILAGNSALLIVIGALIPLEAPVSLDVSSSSFPTAAECMVALILAGVVAGITSSDLKHSPAVSVTDGATAAVVERDHERSRLRVRHCSEGRAALQKSLESSSPPLLTAVVGICERISGVTTGVDNADGPVLLCDIIALYTADGKSKSVPHPHEKLITSRAISALVRMWMGIASKSLPAPAAGDRGEGAIDAKSSSSGLSFAASRIVQTLSLLCLQRPETAAFALRIPHFVKTVIRASQQWPSEGAKWEEDTAPLEPGDAVGLLTALLVSAETLPNTFSEFSAETLSVCLNAALSVMRVGILSSFTTATAPQELTAAPADSSLDATRESEVALRQRKKNRMAAAPRGLILSLRLMTREDVGGLSLREAVGRKGPPAPQSAVSLLRRWVADVLIARSEAKNKMFAAAAAAAAAASTAAVVAAAAVSPTSSLPPSTSSVVETGGLEGTLFPPPALEVEGSSSAIPSEASVDLVAESKREKEDDDDDEDDDEERPAVKDLRSSEEIVDEDSGGDVEEVRHLMKSLQSALQGFSTSKVD